MPGTLAPLQLVSDPYVQQNFEQILRAWPTSPTTQTSLPAGAATGTEIYLQTAAMAALSPPVRWHLIFNGTAWEFLGGASLFTETNNYTTITSTDEGTASTTYAALATAGPVITLPAIGWYDVTLNFHAYHSTGSQSVAMSYDIGATGAVDADATVSQMAVANVDTYHVGRPRRKQFATAAVLTAKYRTTGGTATFRGPRSMTVTPVFLG